MKFVASLILTAMMAFAAGIYFPWWSIAIAAFVVAMVIPQQPVKAFFSAFLALFILWVWMAFAISTKNENILANKIAVLILKTPSPVLLIMITGVIGALVAGFAALAASYVGRADTKIKLQAKR